MKLYVTMIDTFMSGWGKAEHKTDFLVFECDSNEQAKIVADNGRNRTDMDCIKIRRTFPYDYKNNGDYYFDFKTREDYPHWYEKGYF